MLPTDPDEDDHVSKDSSVGESQSDDAGCEETASEHETSENVSSSDSDEAAHSAPSVSSSTSTSTLANHSGRLHARSSTVRTVWQRARPIPRCTLSRAFDKASSVGIKRARNRTPVDRLIF